MKSTPSISCCCSLLFVIIFSCFSPSHSQGQNKFLQCIYNSGINSGIIYTPSNSSYPSILNAERENLRFTTKSTPQPSIIFTPEREREIRGIVLCSKQYGVQIRIRSGGHDFEGLSYTSPQSAPFVILDMFKLDKITIDAVQKTAWVGAGAILGQLYYEISKVSQTLGFPGGFCSTVASGGLFSGGGYGQLMRKYGLAADNVIDARLLDVNGKILDRESMGEDLFWAIRGGGGGSFGVVLEWKVKLVYVPRVITMATVNRTIEQNVVELIQKWQNVAPNLPDEYYFSVRIRSVKGASGKKTVQGTFDIIFNGGPNDLLKLFAQRFPELNVTREDCLKVSWVQTALVFNGYPTDAPPEVLASRLPEIPRLAYKVKTDFVKDPVPNAGLEGMLNFFYKPEAEISWLLLVSSGGKMHEISESALPYPYRAGYLYEIQYRASWDVDELETPQKYIRWVRRVYNFMTPYLPEFPRGGYVNYRDLDLGVNDDSAQIPAWGFQYFKNNFIKLMRIKTKVDPNNFFRHEQSIPTIPRTGDRMEGNSSLLVLKAII